MQEIAAVACVSLMRRLLRQALAMASCSVIWNFSIVMASVGQRTAQRPQRMQRSSSLTIAESGRPFASARARQRAACSASARSSSSKGTIARQYSGQTSTQRLHSTHFSGS